MDFKKNGIPGFSVHESFQVLKLKLENAQVSSPFGFEVAEGDLRLGGNVYSVEVNQHSKTDFVECVEVKDVLYGDTFEGINIFDSSVEFFAAELAKIGSEPIVDSLGIIWPVERISFFAFEGIMRTICWWGCNISSKSMRKIFESEC